MNMSLIVMEGNCGTIDAGDYTCHSYYIIKFSSSLYTLQEDLSIDGQVIPSDEIVCEGIYFFSININSRYYIYKKIKSNKNIISKNKNQWKCQCNILSFEGFCSTLLTVYFTE